MKEQKQKKPEKSPLWLAKLSSALKKNLQRRKITKSDVCQSVSIEEKVVPTKEIVMEELDLILDDKEV